MRKNATVGGAAHSPSDAMADTSRILLTHWSLKYQGAKTCRFLSVKLFLKRWLHWNITAATNGDRMKHINLGDQNCNQPTYHQPVQMEWEGMSRKCKLSYFWNYLFYPILFPKLFQIKIHRSFKTLNHWLCFAIVICHWTSSEQCLMLLLSLVVMMVAVHSDKRWMCLLCSGRRVR